MKIMKVRISDEQHIVKIIDYLENQGYEFDYQTAIYPKELSKRMTKSKGIQITALISGLAGFFLAMWFQFYSAFQYYPIISSDRGNLSFIGNIPIAFEISVLSAGFSAFIAFLILIRKDKSELYTDLTEEFTLYYHSENQTEIENFLTNNQIEFNQIEENR